MSDQVICPVECMLRELFLRLGLVLFMLTMANAMMQSYQQLVVRSFRGKSLS